MSINSAGPRPTFHIRFAASWEPVVRFELSPTFPDTLEGAISCARAQYLYRQTTHLSIGDASGPLVIIVDQPVTLRRPARLSKGSTK